MERNDARITVGASSQVMVIGGVVGAMSQRVSHRAEGHACLV